MAHAEAENEAPVALLGEGLRGLVHDAGVAVMDVGHAGGEGQRARARREEGRVGEWVATHGLRQPYRPVPEGLDARGEVRSLGRSHPLRRTPQAERAEACACGIAFRSHK